MPPARILVVDDDPTLREIIVRLLVKSGYVSLEAASTPAALEHIRAGAVNAVLIDVVLGGENGWDTVRQVREVTDVPILMMTGASVDKDTLRDAALLGTQGMLQKPFEADELLSLLSLTLAHPGICT